MYKPGDLLFENSIHSIKRVCVNISALSSYSITLYNINNNDIERYTYDEIRRYFRIMNVGE